MRYFRTFRFYYIRSIALSICVLFCIGCWTACNAFLYKTKQHSPEEIVELKEGELELRVFYNRPGKKGREIFGELVPYGQVWRTGANEASTFSTNVPLDIGENILPPGTYTLWTRPGPDSWELYFNSKSYPWGVKLSGEASRNPKADVLSIQLPVQSLDQVIELFTIELKKGSPIEMWLTWDQTRIVVPMKISP